MITLTRPVGYNFRRIFISCTDRGWDSCCLASLAILSNIGYCFFSDTENHKSGEGLSFAKSLQVTLIKSASRSRSFSPIFRDDRVYVRQIPSARSQDSKLSSGLTMIVVRRAMYLTQETQSKRWNSPSTDDQYVSIISGTVVVI